MLRRIGLDLFRSSWRYVALVLGGTAAFLIAAPIVGYLPYSDRPGPGWYGLFAGASLRGLLRSFKFVFGWALLTVPFSAFAIVPTLLAVRLFEWAAFPRLWTVSVGALMGAFATLYVVVGVGWYIALDPYTPWLSAMLGAVFGAWVVPRRPPELSLQPLTVAKATASFSALAIIVWLLFPAIPHQLRGLLGMQTDSITVEGTVYRGGSPISPIRVRYVERPESCSGPFVESSTNDGGRFHFRREIAQKNFPANGGCKHEATVCYADGSEWRRLSIVGNSGACGGDRRVEFTCYLDRSYPFCDTKLGW